MKQYEIKAASAAGGPNQSYKMTDIEAEAVRLQNIANGMQHLVDERNTTGDHGTMGKNLAFSKPTKRRNPARPGNHAYVGGKVGHGFKPKQKES